MMKTMFPILETIAQPSRCLCLIVFRFFFYKLWHSHRPRKRPKMGGSSRSMWVPTSTSPSIVHSSLFHLFQGHTFNIIECIDLESSLQSHLVRRQYLCIILNLVGLKMMTICFWWLDSHISLLEGPKMGTLCVFGQPDGGSMYRTMAATPNLLQTFSCLCDARDVRQHITGTCSVLQRWLYSTKCGNEWEYHHNVI